MLRHKSSLPAVQPKEPVLATVPTRDVRAAIGIGGSYADTTHCTCAVWGKKWKCTRLVQLTASCFLECAFKPDCSNLIH